MLLASSDLEYIAAKVDIIKYIPICLLKCFENKRVVCPSLGSQLLIAVQL